MRVEKTDEYRQWIDELKDRAGRAEFWFEWIGSFMETREATES